VLNGSCTEGFYSIQQIAMWQSTLSLYDIPQTVNDRDVNALKWLAIYQIQAYFDRY